jgi:RecA-family ATPase
LANRFASPETIMIDSQTAWGIDPNNAAAIKAALGLPSLLKVTDAAEWAEQETPQRAWLVDEWMPMGRATLLTGEGGTGKSLLAQQLATCTAMGLPFMGIGSRKMNALYLTCEDDLGELHRRQKAICQSLCVGINELEGRLSFVSRRGQLSNSLVDFNYAAPELTLFYNEIKATCHARSAPFLILDNIAHLFDGNENVRYHVAAFCNVMERLASEIGGAVLFLGHPSKAGAQFSGSTAWENQVRSRWFLERPESGASHDHDMRVLKRSKANYSRTGESIDLRWQNWAFVRGDDERARFIPDLRSIELDARHNQIFLECLDRRNLAKRAVSASNQARNYAPKELAKMPEAKAVQPEMLERAMERLFSLGAIEVRELWKDDHRKPVSGLTRAAGQLRPSYTNSRVSYPNGPDEHPQALDIACGSLAVDSLRVSCGSLAGQSLELRDGDAQTLDIACGSLAGQCGDDSGSSGGGGGKAPL